MVLREPKVARPCDLQIFVGFPIRLAASNHGKNGEDNLHQEPLAGSHILTRVVFHILTVLPQVKEHRKNGF